MDPQVSLLVGGIPIATAVFIIVEALKWGQFLRTEKETRLAVLVVALVFGAAWAAVQFAPAISPIVVTLVTAVVGVAVAVSAYQALIGRRKEDA